ncbi:hypothetical protein NBRC110019_28820 [Neptunitalea chrysea]|uniref:Uncharacterized protein n=1 Tax=Neptunitalea chrysea TaxID=1647581 RepID=A0A9W6EW60_9FLAO|nr:hypothetical protein [Neptunitalea chrysea]GLB53841.1 hypothetical protein NBRC110019_28820 [Neptunitalea chrysea]
MKRLIAILVFLACGNLFSQTDSNYMLLSEALVSYGAKYQHECEKAMLRDDMDRIDFLFDSITNKYLKGKYFDPFIVKKLSNRCVDLKTFKKPIFLITLTTWHLQTKGEIEAINELAEQYHKDIEFVVLYWGPRNKAKKASKVFSSKISITYFDERDNKGAYIVGKLKHFFGFPTYFYMNADMSIVSINRGGAKKPFYTEQDFVKESNYNNHFVYIKELLINADSNTFANK